MEIPTDVALGMESAVISLKEASGQLRMSYCIKSEDEDFVTIRTDIYHKAKLYKDKIAPFSKVTIKNIGMVCDEISYIDNIEEFKLQIESLITNVTSNEKLCSYTYKFHYEILSEFKTTEGNAIRIINQLNLSNELGERIREITMASTWNFTKIKEIFTLFIVGPNEDEQIIRSKTIVSILEPLLKSLSNYNNFLKIITGVLSDLLNELGKLKERIDQINDGENVSFKMIQGYAKRINESCSKYHHMSPDYETDLDSIEEGKLNNDYINEWIQNVINKYKKFEDFNQLLTEMKKKDLIELAALKNRPQICS